MLAHHSQVDYHTAASEAAAYARTKMEALIERGRSSAAHLVEKVMGEVPVDALVSAKALRFQETDEESMGMHAGEHRWTLHPHAFGQVATASGVPLKFAQKLSEGESWQKALIAHTFNTMFSHSDRRHLVRCVEHQARGFLSDRFMRLDARPMLESFLKACSTKGALPCDGTGSDIRVAMRAILPTVFEPVPNEVLCLGVQFKTSDYGAGKLSVSSFMIRLWCTNKASLEDSLARVHLGKQLPESIQFSEKTHDLDTQTCVSAISDVVEALLSEERIRALCHVIQDNAETELSWGQVETELAKKLPTLADVETVKSRFEGEQDVMLLPERKTRWRLSNCISLLAGEQSSADRKLELEQMAGAVLNYPPFKMRALP